MITNYLNCYIHWHTYFYGIYDAQNILYWELDDEVSRKLDRIPFDKLVDRPWNELYSIFRVND
jgi:hypothetical protein